MGDDIHKSRCAQGGRWGNPSRDQVHNAYVVDEGSTLHCLPFRVVVLQAATLTRFNTKGVRLLLHFSLVLRLIIVKCENLSLHLKKVLDCMEGYKDMFQL